MTELLNFMKQPAWWISIVGVGVAINILSIYVHKWAGFGFRTVLLKLFRLKEADDARIARDANLVKESELVRTAFLSLQIAASMRTVMALLIGVLLLCVILTLPPAKDAVVSLAVTVLFAIFSMCAAMLNVFRAQYYQQVIQTAVGSFQKEQNR